MHVCPWSLRALSTVQDVALPPGSDSENAAANDQDSIPVQATGNPDHVTSPNKFSMVSKEHLSHLRALTGRQPAPKKKAAAKQVRMSASPGASPSKAHASFSPYGFRWQLDLALR